MTGKKTKALSFRLKKLEEKNNNKLNLMKIEGKTK